MSDNDADLITCTQCGGRGKVAVAECTSVISPNGEEEIACYGHVYHRPNEPHRALVGCPPCGECGGFEEHTDTCSVGETSTSIKDEWLAWTDDETYWITTTIPRNKEEQYASLGITSG